MVLARIRATDCARLQSATLVAEERSRSFEGEVVVTPLANAACQSLAFVGAAICVKRSRAHLFRQ